MDATQFLEAIAYQLARGAACLESVELVGAALGIDELPAWQAFAGLVGAYCTIAGVPGTQAYINSAIGYISNLIRSNIGQVNLFLGLGTGPAQGGSPVACNNTHSSKVQGPGTCCLAVQSGALIPPAPGTTLPVYSPGQAYTLPPGRIATVTDSAGHCASCMIVGSRSTKHPGRPVLKYIRGGPSCPTSGQGCCTLQGGSI
jgi:hypothetical protein